ncbi:hypothetical protein RSOL_116560 [Rhizoctonia solani AG-3 Rhs1AP]|uniref:Uncharacterized protein n=2 Tax=Rhizoctonia solani AG-3 TaxID=1086053 RepID=A0A074RZ36_9AGAM|nr:hypothetical protein RSOL_116560 [Rhizoctonia solani AG-3 Rhs1AP]KEP49923.1 hypothetical protein V565_090370 [Rhizoctonia solani 123E]
MILDGLPVHMGSQLRGRPYAEVFTVITNTKPSQFRNLMEIVYCPPPNKLAIIQPATCSASAWHNFVFYLDVAILSLRFDMPRLDKWAVSELKKLVYTVSRMISDGIPLSEDSYSDGAEALEGSVDMNAEDYPVFRLIDAIWHANKISDKSLAHRLRGIFFYHCTSPPTDTIVSLFKILGLRKRSPSLFGFLFLLLLSKGSETWKRNAFTQTDRMAFFSAQSYLTPLPKSLKLSLRTPLLNHFESLGRSANRFVNEPGKSCDNSCSQGAFYSWVDHFDDGFYVKTCSKEPLVAIKALADIPRRRLDFAEELKHDSEDPERGQCCSGRMNIMEALDLDLQEVYTRVSEYYRPIV